MKKIFRKILNHLNNTAPFPPSKKPEKDADVLVTFHNGHQLLGWWEHKESWLFDFVDDAGWRISGIMRGSESIKHWQYLPRA